MSRSCDEYSVQNLKKKRKKSQKSIFYNKLWNHSRYLCDSNFPISADTFLQTKVQL